MGLFKKIGLALKAKRALDTVEKEVSKGMDWKKTFAKALRDLIVTTVAVGASAALVYFGDPTHLKHALGSLPEAVQLALIPLLSSAIVALQNWLRHRDDLPVGFRRVTDPEGKN